jgi:DNA-binding NtrC family response regulator
VVPNGQNSSTEQQKMMVSLLRHQVLLLAMKNGRAPLPISPALWKGLHRLGFLNDVYDLGSLARRLLFLGDGRILLAELRVQAAAKPTAEEKTLNEMENAKESRPQFEEER